MPLRQPVAPAASVLPMMLGKSATAWAMARAPGLTNRQAPTIAAALAQSSELTLIPAGLGVK